MIWRKRTVCDSTPNISVFMNFALGYVIAPPLGLLISFMIGDGLPFVISLWVMYFGFIHMTYAVIGDIIEQKEQG